MFPYTTEDLVVAERLVDAGCNVLMPWGAPIGSARGLNNVYGLRALRAHFPDIPLVVDAGIGVPSHAAAPWNWAMTPCCSTRPLPKRAIRSRWRGLCARGRGRAPPSRPADGAARHGGALDAGDRQGRAWGRPCSIAFIRSSRIRAGWRAWCRPARSWCSCASRISPGRAAPPGAARPRRSAPRAGAQLIVNDYWQIAIDEHCDFVHLGQEDLAEPT